MKNNVTPLPSQVKKAKNKKLLKKIDKIVNRIEVQVTKLLKVSQQLRGLKTSIEKKAA